MMMEQDSVSQPKERRLVTLNLRFLAPELYSAMQSTNENH